MMHILELYGRNFVPSEMIVKATGVESTSNLINRLRVMDMLDFSKEVVKGCTKHTEILAAFASAAQILSCGE